MNLRFLFLLVVSCLFCRFSSAQIICIECFNQNDSISDNVTNLILNGSFESGCTAGGYYCPNSLACACDLTNWTCTGGGPLTASSAGTSFFTVVPHGSYTAFFGNYFCLPCSQTLNDKSCISDSICSISGIPAGYPVNPYFGYGDSTGVSLEQTVNGLIPGDTLVLEFWAGGESNQAFTLRSIFALDVGFGKMFLRNKPTSVNGIGKRYLVVFIADSTSHTIRFTSWGHICTHCTELVLDDVKLYALSELSSSVNPCSGNSIPSSAAYSSDTIFCEKSCINFFDLSTNNPTSWQWHFPGASPDTSTLQNPTNICYNTYGTYDVTLVACNQFGCDSITFSNFITCYKNPVDSIWGANDTLWSTVAVSYQWYETTSGIITGATNQYYVPVQLGSYFCVVTDSNGCEANSNVITITADPLTPKGGTIQIQPNPATDFVALSISPFGGQGPALLKFLM